MCLMFALWRQFDWKSWFWKILVEFKYFWKTFHLILMHFFFFYKTMCFEEFLHWNALFFKNLFFPDFRSIESVFRSIEITIKNFPFLSFWPIYSSMHHLCLGFTCIALFLYPSCSFAVISLIAFTRNMHTLCYIGYSTWSKNWLINFWAMYFLLYAFFLCEL